MSSYDLFPRPKSRDQPDGIYATDQSMLVDPPPFGTVYRNMKFQMNWDQQIFFHLTYLEANTLKIKSIDLFNCTLHTTVNPKGSVNLFIF